MHGYVLILIKLGFDTEQDRHKHLHWVCLPVALQVTVFPSLRELCHEDAAPEDASSGQQLEQVEQQNNSLIFYFKLSLSIDPTLPSRPSGQLWL